MALYVNKLELKEALKQLEKMGEQLEKLNVGIDKIGKELQDLREQGIEVLSTKC